NVVSDLGITGILSKEYKLPYVVTTRDIHRIPITRNIAKRLSSASALISPNIMQKKIATRYNSSSFLLPHGIDSTFLNQNKEYCKSEVLKIVTFARLLDWKNIDKVIYALEQFDENFQYDIYGDGPELMRLR